MPETLINYSTVPIRGHREVFKYVHIAIGRFLSNHFLLHICNETLL